MQMFTEGGTEQNSMTIIVMPSEFAQDGARYCGPRPGRRVIGMGIAGKRAVEIGRIGP